MPDLKFDAENCDESLKTIGKAFENLYHPHGLGGGLPDEFAQYFKQIVYYTKATGHAGPLKKLAGHIKLDTKEKAHILYLYVVHIIRNIHQHRSHVQEALLFICDDQEIFDLCREAASEDIDAYQFGLPGIEFAYCLYNLLHCRTSQTQYYEQARNLLQIASNINRCTNYSITCFDVGKLKYWIPEIEIYDNTVQQHRYGRVGNETDHGLVPIQINSTSSDGKLEFSFVRLPRECNFEKVRSFIAAPQTSLQNMCARVINERLVTKDKVSVLPLPTALKDFVKECCLHDSTNIDYTHIFARFFDVLADDLVSMPSPDIGEGRIEDLGSEGIADNFAATPSTGLEEGRVGASSRNSSGRLCCTVS